MSLIPLGFNLGIQKTRFIPFTLRSLPGTRVWVSGDTGVETDGAASLHAIDKSNLAWETAGADVLLEPGTIHSFVFKFYTNTSDQVVWQNGDNLIRYDHASGELLFEAQRTTYLGDANEFLDPTLVSIWVEAGGTVVNVKISGGNPINCGPFATVEENYPYPEDLGFLGDFFDGTLESFFIFSPPTWNATVRDEVLGWLYNAGGFRFPYELTQAQIEAWGPVVAQSFTTRLDEGAWVDAVGGERLVEIKQEKLLDTGFSENNSIFVEVTGDGGPDSPNGGYVYYGNHNGYPAYKTVIDGANYYLWKGVIIGPSDDKYIISKNAILGLGSPSHTWIGPANGTIEGDYLAFAPSGATGSPSVKVPSVAMWSLDGNWIVRDGKITTWWNDIYSADQELETLINQTIPTSYS